MDALLRKQGSLYAGARRALIDWATAREALCSLFSAVCNVLNRLRVVHVGALYTRLGVGDALPELATRKQLEALHGLLQSVHEELAALSEVVRQLERLAVDSAGLLQGVRPAQGGGARHGAAPSLADSVEGLEDLWRMHRDELALKAALISATTLDTTEQDLQLFQTLLNAEPNVQPLRRDALLSRVAV